ncbi:MAG: regulatory protein RecX [Deltaproteobacteria bacterium]|jgi:SOS response regulatory protein OraA/RecX|nr:regulatory protein RecX [Deltaproteobacteria bacterium]MBT6433192.1 regulatory protein RecX [Deltaproteobacteria bacterium]
MDISENITRARSTALGYLKKAPLSVGQLKTRLLRKGFTDEVAGQTISMLVETGDLSDRTLSIHLCEKAIDNGRGPRWIEQALARREFADDDITHCIGLARARADDVAQSILKRRYGPVALAEASTRPKAARFLHGRGFEEETIEDALQAVLPPIEY